MDGECSVLIRFHYKFLNGDLQLELCDYFNQTANILHPVCFSLPCKKSLTAQYGIIYMILLTSFFFFKCTANFQNFYV